MNKNILFFSLFTLVFFFSACSSKSEITDVQILLDGLDAYSSGNKSLALDEYKKITQNNVSTCSVFATEKILPLLYESGEYKEMYERAHFMLYGEAGLEKDTTKYQIDVDFLYHYMLLAMINLEKENILDVMNEWLINRSFSREHYTFFSNDTYLEYSRKSDVPSYFIKRIAIQKAVYARDYGLAVREIINSIDYDKDNPDKFFKEKDEYYLSDLGKALLYGTNDNVFFARALEKVSATYPSKSAEAFMCFFYAGRLFEDSSHSNTALSSFESAMSSSNTAAHYDNALWYYLSTVRKMSSRSTISALQDYGQTWNDPSYFDDILNTLAFQLLDNENYKGFYALYDVLAPYMSSVSTSKYAYISALLLESDYVESKSNKDVEIKNLYEKAYNAENGSLYYKMMASVPLNISSGKVLNDILKREESVDKENDTTFEIILTEMLNRGDTVEVYYLFTKHADIIGLETSVLLSRSLSFVNNPSIENNYDDNYYPESLRMAARAFSVSDKNIPREDMMLLYPRYYTDFVTQSAEIYGLDEFIIYALMRSESFFDHDVMSWAGAVGLTQLMPTTAGDVARKLKVKDYNLHDARQNIDFGMFYFDELIPREGVDNSILRALFSYNAGITNVRRWNKQFPELQDNPELFLEKIPFAETREYGRKILSAAVMYGVLYYDMEVADVVQAIMN